MVVEIKRRREIGYEVVEEVAEKLKRLAYDRSLSVRTALVYDGRLSPRIEAESLPPRHGARRGVVQHRHRGHPEVRPPLCGAQRSVRSDFARHRPGREGHQHEDRMARAHPCHGEGMRRPRHRIRRTLDMA